MSTFIQLLLRSLETGSIYALATLGIIVIFRTSHVVHFAQGTMGMFCTYVTAFIVLKTGGLFYIAVFGGLVSAVVMGILVDTLIIRHSTKVSPMAKQIITLGLVMVFLGITPILFGVELMKLPRFIDEGSVEIANAAISYNGLLNISLGIAIMFVLFYMLQKTKLGLAIRTTASNETIARMLGIPTKSVTMITWVIAGALGCLAGIMIAPSTTVTLTLMDSIQINALVACVLGGFQTFYGPVLGAYIIGVVKNILVYYVSSIWGEQLLYLLIFIFMVIRPHGLIGKAPIKKV